MAQIIEVVGFGPVEFPDGMSREQMEVALKKLPKPSEQKQTLHTEETIYDPVSGLPLSSSPIQQNLGGNYATAQKIATGAAAAPISLATGVARGSGAMRIPQLVESILVDKSQPRGAASSLGQMERGMEQQGGEYLQKGLNITGQVAPFVMSGMQGSPLSTDISSKVMGVFEKAPAIPSYMQKVVGTVQPLPPLVQKVAGNTVLGGLSAAASPDATLSDVGTSAAISGALPVVGKTAGWLGDKALGLAQKSSGLATGAGSAPFEQAYMAGKTGNQEFLANMKNPTANAPQIIQDLKNNLSTMRQAKNAEYRSGMLDISKDKSVLGFGEIDKKLNELSKVGVFEGEVLNRKAQETLKNIKKEITAWKAKDPAVFHTPEGMDALKQKLWEFAEDAPVGSRANLVAKDAYNAVKNTISEQAPTYNQVMGKYSDATTQLREIEKALSLGDKSTAAASFSKLMSLMKDTPTANMRKELAQQLIQKGGKDVMPALAGQSLSTYTPTGLIGKGVDAFAAMDLAKALWHGGLTGVPAELATIAATSPKLMGQAYYGAGKTVGALEKLPEKLPLMSNMTPEQRQALARLLLIKGANTAIQGE